jgi:hypothetical protein
VDLIAPQSKLPFMSFSVISEIGFLGRSSLSALPSHIKVEMIFGQTVLESVMQLMAGAQRCGSGGSGPEHRIVPWCVLL